MGSLAPNMLTSLVYLLTPTQQNSRNARILDEERDKRRKVTKYLLATFLYKIPFFVLL